MSGEVLPEVPIAVEQALASYGLQASRCGAGTAKHCSEQVHALLIAMQKALLAEREKAIRECRAALQSIVARDGLEQNTLNLATRVVHALLHPATVRPASMEART